MRSATSEDLTARAALREAALTLFAERGYAGTSVRGVAAAAGVSPALLFHHYGSKEGLREAVDAWLAAIVADAVAGAAQPTERFQRFAAVGRAHPAASDYVARVLGEGGDAAAGLFDRMVATTRAELDELERGGVVRPTDDPEARALLLLFLELGPMLLRPQVERHLGDSLFSDRSVGRWVDACTALLTDGLYA
ncbi:MAG TPA: TetR family transcriptional regulator [Solirubrobacteraceae bacterium]|nr:TetR family transcriptional regulator [Solirubrobacteraceae bacterium]